MVKSLHFPEPAAIRGKRPWSGICLLAVSLLLFFTLMPGMLLAQTTPQYFVAGGTGSNSFPFNTNSTKRTQFIYLPGDLPNATAGNLLKVYFRASTTVAASSFSDFRLRLGQTTATTFPGSGGLDFFTNLTTVISAPTFNIPAPTADGWFAIDIPIPFLFNPAQTLIVEVEMSDRISGGITLRTGTGPAAPNHKRLTATTLTATTGNASTIFHDFGIDVGPSTPCSGTPNAGTAVSSVTSVCPNTNFQLSLTNNTFATGITYQWQASPNGTTGWTDITGATNPNFTTTQTATTHYRARLTCGTASSNSVSVMVTTTATPVSGTYTINKILPNSATNFNSFASAIAFFECGGVNGPLTFNVVANTGPYNEQVVVPAIPGASVTNTITFNGNGNTIVSPTGSFKGAITLNGADFTKFDNFVITLDAASTTGWGVQLLNDANNNTISNNTINLPLNSTSTDVSGIVTGTTTTTAASSTNNSKFTGNTINGGYYGIRINGNTGAVGAVNNQITGNTIRDFYSYGVYLDETAGTLVEGNDISRPNRTTVTTFNGVYMSGVNKNVVVSKNRIHNSFGAASTLTGQSNGINSSSSDAPVGSENIVKNNLIYDMNNTGVTYGIFNTGSDGVYYFHNTINLDNTANTNTVRGFYQTTAATNIKFMNNIVAVNAGTTSTKHALFFNATTSAITSNNNVLYVNPTATNHHIGAFSTTNFTTLANWKTANSNAYDQNSISADPQFTNLATGNLTPMNAAINNAGTALTPPVSDDFLGAVRNPNAPDAGAYEFMNNTTDVGVIAISSPNTVCGLTNQETITVNITNFGTLPQNTIPVTLKINQQPTITEIATGPLAPGATTTFTFATKANLSLTGGYTIQVCTALPGDQVPANDCTTKLVTNSAFTTLPININFETPATGLATVQAITNTRSALSENTAASLPLAGQPATSTKGLVMEGIDNPAWVIPAGVTDPWTTNPEHLSAIKLCFAPNCSPGTPLWLSFDLKQLFKIANANTNFRVTVNGTQVGPTYRPPFTGTPINWQKIYVDLTPFKGTGNIELALESSVKEGFANGAGTANLVDNIRITCFDPSGVKDELLESKLLIYPNPSAGIFTVQAPENIKTYQLQICDLTGKIIHSQAGSHAETLDLRHVAKGIYLLKMVTKNGMAVKRLVIE